MKCKAHNQGDRCRKEAGHEEADPVHEGQFTLWQENKFREEKSARSGPRRNRQLDRFVRTFEPARIRPDARKRMIALMNSLMAQSRNRRSV